MEITDVRVKLINNPTDRLKAYCAVTLAGEFVVRDVKIVDGVHGLFVAMPSRKVSVSCPKCKFKNTVRSRFCNGCGAPLPANAESEEGDDRSRLHRDIAHPITAEFRETMQDRVLEAYRKECDSEGVAVPEAASPEAASPNADKPAPKEAPAPISEYDSLIAGLNSGVPAPSEKDAARSRPPRRDRDGGEAASKDGTKPRRRRRRPKSEDASKPSNAPNETVPTVQAAQSKPKEAVELPPQPPVAPSPKESSLSPATKETPQPLPSRDDSSAFGAGIL